MVAQWTDDIIMQQLVETLPLPQPCIQQDPYLYLLGSVISQQLSTRVADVIYKRFLALFPSSYPQAEMLLELPVEQLRAAGLSQQKATYLKNVAAFHLATPISAAQLHSLTDEEIIVHLTQIKGVGRWTVQMLLMFPLNRPDVFPIADLGIQQSIITQYGITETGKALQAKLLAIAEQWRPHRSLACKYLWLARDTQK